MVNAAQRGSSDEGFIIRRDKCKMNPVLNMAVYPTRIQTNEDQLGDRQMDIHIRYRNVFFFNTVYEKGSYLSCSNHKGRDLTERDSVHTDLYRDKPVLMGGRKHSGNHLAHEILTNLR